jgi:hypothetical protein
MVLAMEANAKIKQDADSTLYITERDRETRICAIELDNDEGWVLERQLVGGDESPERLSCHDTEQEAMAELATYAANSAE